MKILAIDSSSMVASVALAEEGKLICEYTLNNKKTHSQTLLPMIDEMAKITELDKSTIDAIAIAGGPGSFTGLRIGSATAKGMGLAWNVPIINVPTMDAMAYNLFGAEGIVCPIMDARREQVYTGMYSFDEGKFNILKEQCPMDLRELISELNEIGRKVTFMGDGIDSYKNIIEEEIQVRYQFAPIHLRIPKAGALVSLAFVYAAEGRFEKAEEHTPEYLRLSQAERERKEREQLK